MLSRVASHLYWLSRYFERAENKARVLDVGHSLSLLADRAGDETVALEPLVITATRDAFLATGRAATAENVARYLAWDSLNPTSIVSCLSAARENARAVRGSITSEMWENINDTWLQLQAKRQFEREPIDAAFFDWVKERSHLFRGVTYATIRRDQPYHFTLLGTFVERADNTARIVSVKHSAPASTQVDVVTDYYRLSAVLRSVTALEAYRDVYRDVIDARRVVELLVFDPTLPRSLRFCFDQIDDVLQALPQESGRAARRIAAEMLARLRHGSIDEVFGAGLHEYLHRFLTDNVRLGDAVHAAYLEPR